MSSAYQLRVRSAKQKEPHLIDFLEAQSTFENLHQVLAAVTEIPEDEIKVLSGFPPKMLQGARESQLQAVGLTKYEVLIVERRSSNDPPQYSKAPVINIVNSSTIKDSSSNISDKLPEKNKENYTSLIESKTFTDSKVSVSSQDVNSVQSTINSSENTNKCKHIETDKKVTSSEQHKRSINTDVAIATKRSASGGIKEESMTAGVYLCPGSPLGMLQKLEVPSDNSCLFASMDYILTGSISSDRTHALRRLVSDSVLTELELISDYVLDKPRPEYSSWILRDQSWGGEIELALLSKHYSMEIVAVDAKTARVNRFGESSNYKVRVFLLYDGIHYDPLHMESPSSQGYFYTSFPSSTEAVLCQAVDIAAQAHQSGSFTDTDQFTLQCGQCGHKMRGEGEAIKHAKETGHSAFEEVKRT